MSTKNLFNNFEKDFENLAEKLRSRFDIDNTELDIFKLFHNLIERKEYNDAISTIHQINWLSNQILHKNTEHLYRTFNLWSTGLSYYDAASISNTLFVRGKHQVALYKAGKYGPDNRPTGEVITAKMVYEEYGVDMLYEIFEKGSAIIREYDDH